MQNLVSPRKLAAGTGEGGSYTSGNVTEAPLTLSLRGLTVRQAMEKFVEVSERKVWIVTFAEGLAKTPTGFYRTETLWHPRPFPDRDQPMWDFLAWGEYTEIHKTLESSKDKRWPTESRDEKSGTDRTFSDNLSAGGIPFSVNPASDVHAHRKRRVAKRVRSASRN